MQHNLPFSCKRHSSSQMSLNIRSSTATPNLVPGPETPSNNDIFVCITKCSTALRSERVGTCMVFFLFIGCVASCLSLWQKTFTFGTFRNSYVIRCDWKSTCTILKWPVSSWRFTSFIFVIVFSVSLFIRELALWYMKYMRGSSRGESQGPCLFTMDTDSRHTFLM